MLTHAITRLPGENFADGLTTANLGRPSYLLILEQHQAYRQALSSLGLEVIVLPAEPGFPDAYFVEDACIITPDLAVITRPGAASRRGEEISLEPVIRQYRRLAHIHPPGTVDGGDILMVEDHFFIGLSERTNYAGAAQLTDLLSGEGFTTETIPVAAGLHLKSGVNYLGRATLLITKSYAQQPGFAKYRKIILEAGDDYAANTLWINDTLLMPKGYPRAYARLARLGMQVIELDVSEVHKMDGGLTCISLRF